MDYFVRELHDTMLQSFHGLLLRFQTASELFPTRPAEAKQTLDSATMCGTEDFSVDKTWLS
jgi:signal transduction histidine kinase